MAFYLNGSDKLKKKMNILVVIIQIVIIMVNMRRVLIIIIEMRVMIILSIGKMIRIE